MQGFWRLLISFLVVSIAVGQDLECLTSSYVTEIVQYNNSVLLECAAYGSYRWWQSEDGCRLFSQYSACAAQQCTIRIDASRRGYLYYCCTSANVTQLTSSTAKSCFEIDICTNVVSSPGPPPLAFFGQKQKVFVQMYAEPQPSTHSPEVFLVVNSVSMWVHQLEVEIFRTTSAPLLTWVYTLDVPDVDSADNATLEFSATYGTAHDTQCSGDNVVSYDIPVIRSTRTVSMTTVSTTTSLIHSSPTPDGSLSPTTMAAMAQQNAREDSCEGYVIGFSVVLGLVILGCIASNLLVGFVCHHVSSQRTQKSEQEASSDQAGVRRPKTLFSGLTYRQLKASGSATPTPVTPMTQRTLTDSKPKEGALQTQQAAADITETA